jgi:hypothetical protein
MDAILYELNKLFTAVLNARIYGFLDENSLLGNEHAGFRKQHSTTDHVFSLHCLIDLYLQRRKNCIVHLLIIENVLTVSSTVCCGRSC